MPAPRRNSPAQAWARALELTAPIARNPGRVLPLAIDELADEIGNSPALLSDGETFTYRELAARSNRYSRWALDRGISRGEAVCLLMPNRPEYMAIWLGITRVGGIVALLNTNLSGRALAHCIELSAARQIIVAEELLGQLAAALSNTDRSLMVWVCGHPARAGHDVRHDSPFKKLDDDIAAHAGDRLSDNERRATTIQDTALYIYTSGTTGPPKAANVSHARVMQWSYWFAGLMDTCPADRMYNCLPMYHSVGGVLATGAVLAGGGSVVVRDRFSAREFWNDVVRWECTLFQYIGELCRYLLHAEPDRNESAHRLRLCCGNGLRGDIWNDFRDRFRIPQILEFYAATEGNVSFVNVEGKVGAVGRIPPFLAHRFPATLITLGVDSEQPVRNSQGFCVPCRSNEVGEAIGPIDGDPANIGARFEGYTDVEASERKILRNVFKPGDAWFRTGDLMRKDDQGFFYFVDRLGDTFRWKGENVAASDVVEALCEFPGVKHANVYGVSIPGTDGRAGMAVIVADDLDLSALRRHLIERLPTYARPVFFRIRKTIEITGTFKYTKSDLLHQGFDPATHDDPLYFNAPEHDALVPVDAELFQRINTGQIRL